MNKMKRQDIVNKLLSEGFSEKTLVNFSDKQLRKLGGMLSEQSNFNKGTLTVDKPTTPDKIKQYTDRDIDVKMDVDEEDSGESYDNLKAKLNKLKIEATKSKKENGKVSEELKSKMADVRVAMRNAKGFKGKNDSITEWVDEVANKKYTNLTLKNEIMEMVATKVKKGHNGIPEFMTYEAIVGAAKKKANANYADETYGDGGVAEPTTKPRTRPGNPTTKPGSRPKPRTPYQPGPGINPNPRAGVKRLKK